LQRIAFGLAGLGGAGGLGFGDIPGEHRDDTDAAPVRGG
jgi:hypothetical protein